MRQINKLKLNKKEWNEFAKIDPMWSILTHDTKKFRKWDKDVFFSTGFIEVQDLMKKINGLMPNLRHERMIDFGCGVGRITQAMSQYFKTCYGVDISSEMIRLANFFNQKNNCHYSVNPKTNLSQFKDKSFDLIYCRLVLQHLPNKYMMENYIKEFYRTLDKGGIMIFQLPTQVSVPSLGIFDEYLYRILKKIIGVGLLHKMRILRMRMTAYPEKEIMQLLKGLGVNILLIETDGASGPGTSSRTFYITR